MNSMLDEQKRINEELLSQMKQMQHQMKMMSNFAQGRGPPGGGMRSNMGNGGGMGPGYGGPKMGNNFSYSDDSDEYGGMGSGYSGDFGGGKMGVGMVGGMVGRPMPYNMRIPKQPGDWDCPQCGNMNFARRHKCNGEGGSCQVIKRPEFVRQGMEGGPKNRRPGDWDCSRCGNMNYARRNSCNKCQTEKDVGMICNMPCGGDVFGGGMDTNMGPSSRGGPLNNPGGWTDGPASKLETRPGDWKCKQCSNINFSWRDKCNKCEEPRGNTPPEISVLMSCGFGGGSMLHAGMIAGRPEARPGDWDCPRCWNMNFSSRNKCNGTLNGESCLLSKPSFEEYGVALIKNKDMKKPGDWNCFRCGNINFKIREECNKCQLPKEDAISETFRNDGGDILSKQ